MRKKLFKLLVVFILCISPLMGLVVTAQAQETVATPTPVPSSTQEPIVSNTDPNVVTFEQLQLEDIRLVGPYDGFNFTFALPADWRLLQGAQLNLLLGVSFSTPTLTEFDYPVVLGGGTLSVLLNGNLVSVLALNEIGEVEENIQIPLDAFVSDRLDERIEVDFVLESGDFCYVNEQFNMFIHGNSYFFLPHELIQPDTNLVNFPRPLYQNSFNEDSALVVIPDQPSSSELQAALTVVAGLGNLSQNNIILDVTKLSQLSPDLAMDTHLIFVGKAASLPVLNDLQLPLPVSDGNFQVPDGGPDDGVVQMIVSPWSNAHVALVVSGNTDQATTKAAQAISTGFLRPNRFPNLAIVQEVQPTEILAPGPIDKTLADFGYNDRLFQTEGSFGFNFPFYIPPGMTASPDAYFELIFGHSANLNFDRSAIVILVNNRPVGSAQMDETSAEQAKNQVKVEIPASALRPGPNNLGVRAVLWPKDECAPRNAEGTWLRIWSESLLHLPIEQVFFDAVSDLDLGSFPEPFSYDPTLGTTAFVLPRDDLEVWRSATQLAAFLGNEAGGSVTTLSVFFGDDFPETEREKYNLLLVGRPTQLPILNEFNDTLPAPFLQGSDVVTEADFQVDYLIPPDSPQGYVELISSPWNAENAVLTLLGNTVQGVTWATSSLYDPNVSGRLAGNFAVVNDQQILTTDTRSAVSGANEILVPTPEVDLPIDVSAPSTIIDRPDWILPVLLITLAVIILVLAFVIVGNVRRNRARKKSEKKHNVQAK